jgi:hypothetical protein
MTGDKLGQYIPIIGDKLGQYIPMTGDKLGQSNHNLGILVGFFKPKIGLVAFSQFVKFHQKPKHFPLIPHFFHNLGISQIFLCLQTYDMLAGTTQ